MNAVAARGAVRLRSGRARTRAGHHCTSRPERLFRRRGILRRAVASFSPRGHGARGRRQGARRPQGDGQPRAAAVGQPVRDHPGQHRHRGPRGGDALNCLRALLRDRATTGEDWRGRSWHGVRALGRHLPPRGVRGAGPARRNDQQPGARGTMAGARPRRLCLDHEAVHVGAQPIGRAGADAVRPQARQRRGERTLGRRAAHPGGAEPGGGRAGAPGRRAHRGRVRVLREECPRGDDSTDGHRRARHRHPAGGDDGLRDRDAAVALPGVRGDDRQHHRPDAGQGSHPGVAQSAAPVRREGRDAPGARGAGLARGGGSAGRLQAPQGTHGRGARRVRRHGGHRDDGRPAGGDRRRDSRRAR